MAENNNEIPEQIEAVDDILESLEEKKETHELAFCVAGSNQTVIVQFADGQRKLSSDIVRGLGGFEKIQEQASVFAEVNYNDFLAAFFKTKEKENLNRLGQKLISLHFKPKFNFNRK